MADQAKTRKKPKLTPKQGKFVRGIIEGKTQTQAAFDAYNVKNRQTANAVAQETLQNPSIKEALALAYQQAGITADAIAGVLSDAMQATKTASVDGEVFESSVADHAIRVTAARTAAQLVGAGKDNDSGGGVHFHFNPQSYVKKS